MVDAVDENTQIEQKKVELSELQQKRTELTSSIESQQEVVKQTGQALNSLSDNTLNQAITQSGVKTITSGEAKQLSQRERTKYNFEVVAPGSGRDSRVLVYSSSDLKKVQQEQANIRTQQQSTPEYQSAKESYDQAVLKRKQLEQQSRSTDTGIRSRSAFIKEHEQSAKTQANKIEEIRLAKEERAAFQRLSSKEKQELAQKRPDLVQKISRTVSISPELKQAAERATGKKLTIQEALDVSRQAPIDVKKELFKIKEEDRESQILDKQQRELKEKEAAKLKVDTKTTGLQQPPLSAIDGGMFDKTLTSTKTPIAQPGVIAKKKGDMFLGVPQTEKIDAIIPQTTTPYQGTSVPIYAQAPIKFPEPAKKPSIASQSPEIQREVLMAELSYSKELESYNQKLSSYETKTSTYNTKVGKFEEKRTSAMEFPFAVNTLYPSSPQSRYQTKEEAISGEQTLDELKITESNLKEEGKSITLDREKLQGKYELLNKYADIGKQASYGVAPKLGLLDSVGEQISLAKRSALTTKQTSGIEMVKTGDVGGIAKRITTVGVGVPLAIASIPIEAIKKGQSDSPLVTSAVLIGAGAALAPVGGVVGFAGWSLEAIGIGYGAPILSREVVKSGFTPEQLMFSESQKFKEEQNKALLAESENITVTKTLTTAADYLVPDFLVKPETTERYTKTIIEAIAEVPLVGTATKTVAQFIQSGAVETLPIIKSTPFFNQGEDAFKESISGLSPSEQEASLLLREADKVGVTAATIAIATRSELFGTKGVIASLSKPVVAKATFVESFKLGVKTSAPGLLKAGFGEGLGMATVLAQQEYRDPTATELIVGGIVGGVSAAALGGTVVGLSVARQRAGSQALLGTLYSIDAPEYIGDVSAEIYQKLFRKGSKEVFSVFDPEKKTVKVFAEVVGGKAAKSATKVKPKSPASSLVIQNFLSGELPVITGGSSIASGGGIISPPKYNSFNAGFITQSPSSIYSTSSITTKSSTPVTTPSTTTVSTITPEPIIGSVPISNPIPTPVEAPVSIMSRSKSYTPTPIEAPVATPVETPITPPVTIPASTTTSTSTTTTIPVSVTTPTPMIGTIIPFPGMGRKRRVKKSRGRGVKTRYTPGFTALAFGITTTKAPKKGKLFSGSEIRPIVIPNECSHLSGKDKALCLKNKKKKKKTSIFGGLVF